MDDAALVRSFEAGEIPAGGFHHEQHVRVAWCYVRDLPLADAIGRFQTGLKRFADAQGQPGLYHETITLAYVLLIHERLADAEDVTDSASFMAANADLLTWKPSVLDRYYTPETLWSDRARRTFVMPDRLRGA